MVFLRFKYDFVRYPEIGKKNPAKRIDFVNKYIESERNDAVTAANYSVSSRRFGDESTALLRTRDRNFIQKIIAIGSEIKPKRMVNRLGTVFRNELAIEIQQALAHTSGQQSRIVRRC